MNTNQKLYLVYIQVVKNSVSLRKVTVMFIVTVNISIFQCYIYIMIYTYILSSKNGTEIEFINLNSLKSCRLLSAYKSHRPVLNTNLLSIFQDHLFNTRFIQYYL